LSDGLGGGDGPLPTGTCRGGAAVRGILVAPAPRPPPAAAFVATPRVAAVAAEDAEAGAEDADDAAAVRAAPRASAADSGEELPSSPSPSATTGSSADRPSCCVLPLDFAAASAFSFFS
jgi:hypothetical protein